MKTHQENNLTPKYCLQLRAPEKQTAEEYSENSVVACLVWSGMATIGGSLWLYFFKS